MTAKNKKISRAEAKKWFDLGVKVGSSRFIYETRTADQRFEEAWGSKKSRKKSEKKAGLFKQGLEAGRLNW